MSDLPDQTLIANCMAGQTSAFGQLVERYQQRLYGSLYHITGSAEMAADVAQETFLHAFQKLASFRGESQFYSWLFRIAWNAAISERRKMRRGSLSIEAFEERTGCPPDGLRCDADPSNSLESLESQEQVQRALAELPDEYRTVLILKEFEELKYDEIAELLAVPVGTVRSRIHRARLELRSKLQLAWKVEQS